jgi:hypothetical protein
MKKILAFFSALVVALTVATPAYAATLSSAEQNVLGEFKTELEYWGGQAGLDANHIDQYYSEAKRALEAVDLSDAACAEFSGVIKECHDMLSGVTTKADMWSHYTEIANAINKVGEKYYSLHVTVDATTKYATVTWKIAGGTDASGSTTNGGSTSTTGAAKTSVAATTKKVVNQTGASLGQTIAVTAACAAVLGGAFVVARKKQLFA